ncbi:uncharacterized protein BCR38DRAFT_340790 [Pseudomassariella vexata]|uniref:Oxidase ustYa n=1 Tax=Pseudomassariella vexata TaxID=1141098 RepID=A0A1Y2E0P9_9PEZI|nr:uncharacterized protein BCR38DRAFT_340790 [Pseudomassariella vexata]ORY65118.1 hypothetical protein BCR38DRAFT_340790 [Pseudomassariella vexata]
MGDEKHWQNEDFKGRLRSKRNTLVMVIGSVRLFVDCLLLLIIAALLLLLWEQWKETSSGSWQVGGDFTGAGPEFTTHVVKWEADSTFVPSNMSEWFSNETLAKWNTIMPAGTHPAPSNETFFTTSVTHQLHCLFIMGRIYSGVVTNMTEILPVDYHTHMMHCIDYMRQAVMCSADVALEPHELTDSDDNGPGDGGWNGHHVCKDYNQVIPYLEQQIVDGIRTVLPIDD